MVILLISYQKLDLKISSLLLQDSCIKESFNAQKKEKDKLIRDAVVNNNSKKNAQINLDAVVNNKNKMNAQINLDAADY